MKTIVTTLALALAVATGGIAAAQDAHVPNDDVLADLYVTDHTQKFVEPWLDEEHRVTLKSLAYQYAVATACEDFSIDRELFAGELAELYPGDESALPDEQEKALDHAVLLSFGALYGAKLAIAARDLEGFCAHAAEERAAPETAHLIWASQE